MQTQEQALSVMPPADLLQVITVISPTTRDFIINAVRRAVTLEVLDDDSYAASRECLNSLTKSKTVLGDAVTEARRPVLAFAKAISDSAGPLEQNILDAHEILAPKIKLYQEQQEAKRQRILAEQRRLEEEARQKAEAERQAREKVAAEAAAKAEALRREQERLAWEAQERERLAAEAILKGNKKAADVTANAKALEEAAELDRKAEAARLEAEQAQREADEAQRQSLAPVVMTAPAPVVMAAPAPTKGLKTKRVVDGLAYDVAALPPAYLTANETLLKRHILDGVVTLATPGVKAFQIAELLTGSGR
jgi:hypothetical protein